MHNPDESDSCKAEGRERGERREERGEQAQAALRDTHLAGKAAGVIQGCWSRRLEQGCPCLPPCGERHKAASRTFWKVLPCPPHFKPQNLFPVPASLLSPLGASPTASPEGGERAVGCWNYRINFSAWESKHLPGSRRQPGCQDPPAPGVQAEGRSPGCSGTAATSPGWFAGLGAAGKGKAEPGSSHRARQEASAKVSEPEQRGRTVPFPLGSWLRTHQLSCGCRTGREGEEEHQVTARGARRPHVQMPVCVRCRSHPRTAAGAGRRRRKAGRKGRSTRQPGCSSSCSDPFTTSGSSRR